MNKAALLSFSSFCLAVFFVCMLLVVKIPQGFSMEVSVPYAVISVDSARPYPIEITVSRLLAAEGRVMAPQPRVLTPAEELLQKIQQEYALQRALARSA